MEGRKSVTREGCGTAVVMGGGGAVVERGGGAEVVNMGCTVTNDVDSVVGEEGDESVVGGGSVFGGKGTLVDGG